MANGFTNLSCRGEILSEKESGKQIEKESESTGSYDSKCLREELQLDPVQLLKMTGKQKLNSDVSRNKRAQFNLPDTHDDRDSRTLNYLNMQQSLETENREFVFGSDTCSSSHKVMCDEKYSSEPADKSGYSLCQNSCNYIKDGQGIGPKSLDTNSLHSESNIPCDCDLVSTSGHKSLPIFPSQDRLNGITTSNNVYLKKHKSIPYLHSALLRQNDSVELKEAEQSEKVKNKIMSVWNNVRYGKFYYK